MRKAIAIAQTQGTRSLELRASANLLRLLREQGRADEQRQAFATLYGQFNEGLATPDLEEARALLDDPA